MGDDFLKRISSLSQKQLVLLAGKLQAKLEGIEAARQEPVAVIGLGCRFPGGGHSPEAFWRVLEDGVNCARPVGRDRWNMDAFYDPDPAVPGKMYTRHAALLDTVDDFDAEFFSVPAGEAEKMDPQQRLLLEVAWEAIEHAGYAPPRLAGSRTAVFVGVMNHDYEHLQNLRRAFDDISGYVGVGTALSVAAGRLSYFLGLKGPSVALDTACSSSLVTVHLACQSLRNRESDLALAGGVNLILSPTTMIAESKAMMLAPDGRCKTFDASADGYGRGEGCGIVVLKRLTDARRDGDTVLAVIRGSAVNQDGRSQGLTAPNGPAQQAVIEAALANAGVHPHDVDYVEAHGTGTPLGDPIEIQALGAVYGAARANGTPLLVGSVKTNVGHLESAAGVAGLIKLILALQHRTIPAHLNLQKTNPHIDLERHRVAVPTTALSWPAKSGKKRVGATSSFGFSGTNAHVIVEEAEAREPAVESGEAERTVHVLALSAKSEAGLQQLAGRYARHLREHEEQALGDICYTANTGRAQFAHRLVALGAGRAALVEQLSQAEQGEGRGLIRAQAPRVAPKVGFLFTGQGAQYAGMGRELYPSAPVFRQAIDRCAELLHGELEVALPELLWGEASGQLNQTRYTQPALFALEYALAMQWQAWGVQPGLLLGHSVGEVVAACIAGVFSLEDGLKLIAARGRLMEATAAGAMVAVLAAAATVQAHVVAGSGVVIAAHNGPSNTVIAGPPAAVQALVQALHAAGIETHALAVTRAFHSPSMQPILDAFAQVARAIRYQPARIPVISNESGALAGPDISTAEYWVRHIAAPVQFAAGMQALQAQGPGVYLEIGPGATLLGMGRRCVSGEGAQWLASLHPSREPWAQISESLGRLYVSGIAVDWAAFDAGHARRRVALPTYAFQRQRYWFSETEQAGAVLSAGQAGLLPYDAWLGNEMHSGSGEVLYVQRYTPGAPLPLQDHRLHGRMFLPAAAHAVSALAGAQRLLEATPAVLENLAVDAALELGEQGSRLLQYAFVPEGEGGYSWRAYSRADAAHSKPADWQAHASGRIVPGQGGAAEPLLPQARQRLLERCPHSLQREALYERLAQLGYGYGPAFRGIAQLHWNEGEAIARIEPPQPEAQAAGLSAALLDACFQSALFAAFIPGADTEQLYVPVGVDRLRMYGSLHAPLWCHCTLRGTDRAGEMLVADLRVYRESGELAAQIEGLCGRRVAQALLRNRLEVQEWLYELQWVAQPLPQAHAPVSQPQGAVLIFADAGGLGEQLAARLRREGVPSACVYRGERRRAESSRYDIDASCAQDFAWLLSELAQHQGAPRAIVYLWGQDAAAADQLDAARLRADQRMQCGGLLHLIQALHAMRWAPRLWLITRGAQALSAGEAVGALSASSLWGLGRSIEFEHEELRCVRLDVDPALREVQEQAGLLQQELQADGAETQIAYRGGQRYVARLAHAAQPQALAPVAIRADATYLISGGLGSLGLVFARWLVEQGARQLVLLGRRAPTGAGAAELDSLRAQGARVEVLGVDVADASALERAWGKLAGALPPLAGVIHAAGVLRDGLITTQPWAEFESVLAPKVLGAWNLHRLSAGVQLDFFVLFSSAASLIGSPGQGAYAAANAFLDALAWQRRGQGLAATSINWGPWSAGMAAHSGADVRLRRSGMRPIEVEQGPLLFAHILAAQATQMGVMSVDWARAAAEMNPASKPVFQFVAAATQTTDLDYQRVVAEIRNAPQEQQRALLVNHVREEIAGILQLDSLEEVDPDANLFDLGFDSMSAVQLRNSVRTRFGLVSPPTLLATHPTATQLADYFAVELLERRPEAEPALA